MIPINPPLPSGPQVLITERVRANAQAHPDRAALVCGGETRLWGAFDARVNRVANLVGDVAGKGAHVAVLAPNSLAYAEIFNGILRAGACVVPLSTMASAAALEKMLRDCGARAIFVAQPYLALVEGFIAQMPLARFAIDFEHPDFEDYAAAVEAQPETDPAVPIALSDPFNLIYSSGTTGTPKGIIQTHAMRAAQMDRVTPNGYDDGARTLLSTPLYSNTTLVSFLPTLFGGSTAYLMPKFDALGWVKLAEAERITHTMLVPVQYQRIMALPEFDQFDLSAMRVKFCTSAPLRAALKRDVLARFPGKLIEYYGLTEGGGVSVLNAAEHPDKLHTIGQPAPGNDIRLIGEDGSEVPQGAVGEIVGRGPTMMAGYHGRDDLTEAYLWRSAEGEVFFRSGDMARYDADGFLVLSDRKKDMIISGGLNVFADDLEQALLADPDVVDAAVIAVPSEAWGETPLGLVVLRDGAMRSPDTIRAATNARLGKHQRLSGVELRAELPRSSIGKILKRELRAPYWEGEMT